MNGATLSGVVSGSVTGVPLLPTGWIMAAGFMVGPDANLAQANLSNTDLSNTDLQGTILTGANLSGVTSGSITGSPTLPENWSVVLGYLVGPYADLSNANLAGGGFLTMPIFQMPILRAPIFLTQVLPTPIWLVRISTTPASPQPV
jgi:uncharacterized protein YjbI with pentapeptide repeats